MKKRRNTYLNAILADIDEKTLPNGKDKYFSIAFVTKQGEYIYIHRAKKVGLKKALHHNDNKGIQQVDVKVNSVGHIYPVWIHSIIMYKGTVTYGC